ncbi:hypothetical protein FQN52_004609 [Onygenales sp. PD_12]|nr:hypothetical protein FQN52_004609 [Onygenales sp. PD_12]
MSPNSPTPSTLQTTKREQAAMKLALLTLLSVLSLASALCGNNDLLEGCMTFCPPGGSDSKCARCCDDTCRPCLD